MNRQLFGTWQQYTLQIQSIRLRYNNNWKVHSRQTRQGPRYTIADSGCPQLRSAHAHVLIVPRTNIRFGDRSFSVAGPKIWNSLPASLRQFYIEFGHFKRLLKAFLFNETAAH